MDEDLVPIIVIGLAIAAVLIKTTSGYTQGEIAGIPGRGYDITQQEPPLVIPLSTQKGGIPSPPVKATRDNLSKPGTQMPYGVVPADIRTDSLIDQPAKLSTGQDPALPKREPTASDLGPTALTNPNTPPDVKIMLANAPPGF